MYYSATIIQMAGFYDTAKAIWLSALVASVNFICTFLGIYLVEKVGRRRLTLGSLLGVILSLAFLAVGFMIVDSNGYAVTEFYHDKTDLCNSASWVIRPQVSASPIAIFIYLFFLVVRECNECNSIIDCGFCFMDNPANGGVLKGSCLLSKENSTFLSDYGPCSNLSSTVYRSILCPSLFRLLSETIEEETTLILHLLLLLFSRPDLLVALPLANRRSFMPMGGVHHPMAGSPSWDWWLISSFSLQVETLTFWWWVWFVIDFLAKGMGPMPWTINAEIYPLWARSTCNSIATSTNWFFNFLVSMTFLTITEILTRQGKDAHFHV